MWNNNKSFPARGFSTPPPARKPRPMMPMSERKRSSPVNNDGLFHVIHKVPSGDSPYVKAKQVQLIDKDPSRAISLFWAAINAGDRVDSALKDMAIVMKQLDRSDEAIEAIKSFRHLCPCDTQESLDNVLVELYKRSGRIEEEIEMLQRKLKRIEEGLGFGGKRTKTARSQGKKVQITVEQEISRILGNLAWAYLQKNNYVSAEEYYRKALSLELDMNKQCNLAICLMHMNRTTEAKSLLHAVRAASRNREMDESYAKSFERGLEMLTELESQSVSKPIEQKEDNRNEIQRSMRPPVNINLKEVNNFINGGQHYVSQLDEQRRESYCRNQLENKDSFFGYDNGTPKCRALGPSSLQLSPQTMSVDKWKKCSYFENSSERRSGFATRMKENRVGSTGTEVSPAPARRNLNVPFTQPRRCSWGFNNGQQRREVWGDDAVGRSSRKLSFEPPLTRENAQALAIQDVNEDWRRSGEDLAQVKDEAVIKSMSQSMVSGDPKRLDGYAQVTRYDSQHIGNGNYLYNEPPMVVDNVRPLESSEECFRKNSPGFQQPPITENPKPKYDTHKKSWADIAEEEEQELLSGRTLTECYNGWNSEEEFNDENLNSNIIRQSPRPQSQIKSLSCKFESLDLKDRYDTSGNAVPSRNPTVRRPLSFDQQQKPESTGYFCSPPLPNGRDSVSEENIKLMRRNRLQVFQDITLHPESP